MGLIAKLFGPKEPEVWPVHIDDENFEKEVFQSDVPVLLDVWGPNCAPCKQFESIVIRLAKEYQGKVKVAEVNHATAPKVARRLRVTGTPTAIYFNGRVEVARVVGFRGELYHRDLIDNELLPRAAEAAERATAKRKNA